MSGFFHCFWSNNSNYIYLKRVVANSVFQPQHPLPVLCDLQDHHLQKGPLTHRMLLSPPQEAQPGEACTPVCLCFGLGAALCVSALGWGLHSPPIPTLHQWVGAHQNCTRSPSNVSGIRCEYWSSELFHQDVMDYHSQHLKHLLWRAISQHPPSSILDSPTHTLRKFKTLPDRLK